MAAVGLVLDLLVIRRRVSERAGPAVAEGARRACPFVCFEYLKVGIPVTLPPLATGVLLLG